MTLGLADALANPPGTTQRCRFARTIAELDTTDQEAVEQALEAIRRHRTANGKSPYGPTATWLSSALTQAGVPIGAQPIRQHVSGRCVCAS